MIGAAFDRARLRRPRPIRAEALGSGRSGALEAGGVRLRAWRGGPERPELTVVVVPDPPNVIEHHRRQLDDLATDVGVLAVELPGFGRSALPAGFDFTIESYAQALGAALDAHTEGPLVLAFTCLGGLIALSLADRSERVAGLLLTQTPGLTDALAWAERVDPGGILATPLLGQLAVRAGRRRLAKTWYDAALPRGANPTPWVDTALAAYDEGAEYCLASALQALGSTRTVGSVAVPTTILWGSADRTHRPSDPERLASAVAELRVRRLEGAGHFPDLEAPEVFTEELRLLRERLG